MYICSLNFCSSQDVKFSLDLDVFELCTQELQNKLTPMRAKFKEMEDRKVEEAQKVWRLSANLKKYLIKFIWNFQM